MNDFQIIQKLNILKWHTLPAGKERRDVRKLLHLDDEELLHAYTEFVQFWEQERGWEYERYAKLFQDRNVLEIGSGLGYDGFRLSMYTRSWTFSDIIKDNLCLVQRICTLKKRSNVYFEYIADIERHCFSQKYDGLYAHGVFHHVPFDVARNEVANISNFLKPGAKVVLLMYPKQRWEECGSPPFNKFGLMTDGENTPWAEWYDEEKVMKLMGPDFKLLNSIYWGNNNSEFVNFEFTKL